MKMILKTVAAVAVFAAAAPAMAAVPVSDGACTIPNGDTTPSAIACTGYYSGNLFDGNSADTQAITDALSGFQINYTGNLTDYQGSGSLSGATDLSSLFGDLTGIQVIGIHFGGSGGGQSAFYEIDFGPAPGQPLMLDLPASSNAYLFGAPAAVPEPATWALMLLGFGAVGMSMRRRRQPRLMQIA